MDLSLDSSKGLQKHFKKGDVLFKTSAKVDKVYLVSSGKIMLFTTSSNRIIPLYVAGPNSLVGEECLFSKEYTYYAVAITDTTVVPVNVKDIKDFLKTSPEWVSNIINLLSSRLVSTQNILKEHKIVDPLLNDNSELSSEDESFLQTLL